MSATKNVDHKQLWIEFARKSRISEIDAIPQVWENYLKEVALCEDSDELESYKIKASERLKRANEDALFKSSPKSEYKQLWIDTIEKCKKAETDDEEISYWKEYISNIANCADDDSGHLEIYKNEANERLKEVERVLTNTPTVEINDFMERLFGKNYMKF